MSGQQIGYIRVSTVDQNTARQLEGIALNKAFEEKASAKNTTGRPQLEACIAYLREGDTLHVHSMDRLARNLDDLRGIVKALTAKGVAIRFHKEQLTFTGEDSPMAVLLLSVMGAFAEFERSLIRERQREGIAVAKGRGVYTGRKPALSPERAAELRQRAEAGEKKAIHARDFGINRNPWGLPGNGRRQRVRPVLADYRKPQVRSQALNDPAILRGLLANYSEKVIALESKINDPIAGAHRNHPSDSTSANPAVGGGADIGPVLHGLLPLAG